MFEIINADCVEAMRAMEPESVDAVVTDPPYGLSKDPDIAEVLTKWLAGAKYEHTSAGFMGKTWDSFVPGPEYWRECHRVLRPGGHLLAFSGTRTQDLMCIAIRLGGFEIRDVNAFLNDGSEDLESFERSLNDAQLEAFRRLMTRGDGRAAWLFGSGFPKSHNISKAIDKAAGSKREITRERKISATNLGQGSGWNSLDTSSGVYNETAPATEDALKWDGWGTALKPAHEPIVMARKPFAGTIAANVLEHGTGAINIDGCRVGDETTTTRVAGGKGFGKNFRDDGWAPPSESYSIENKGRFPANLMHDGSDAVLGIFPETKVGAGVRRPNGGGGVNTYNGGCGADHDYQMPSSEGSAARYFYCAKASKADRCEGTERLVVSSHGTRALVQAGPAHQLAMRTRVPMQRLLEHGWHNNHPTVKPTALMQYLCRLVTPPNGVILDPFMGSGSTGVAAIREGFRFIGIDRESEYCEIARRRIELASSLKIT